MSTSRNDDSTAPNDDHRSWYLPLPYDEDEYPNIFSSYDDELNATIVGKLRFYGYAAAVFFGLIIIFYLLYKFVIFSFLVALKSVPELYTTLGMTIFSCAISGGLFWLKVRNLVIYGIFELAFAIFTTWASVNTVIDGGGRNWLIVVAAIYVTVRGLDNVNSGSGYKWLRPPHALRKSSQGHSRVQSTGDPQNE